MSQLIPFESANLPAYLRGVAAETNSDILSHASNSYPIISIKGKIFTVSRDGEKVVIPNPKDPDSPATKIEMVLVKVNKGTSKVFYAKGYTDGSDDKPNCFSNDGIRPDATVEVPISKTCATCKNNVWGSKISENGKKIKACSDSVRVAVATPDKLDDPYFMRVPAASIKNLGDFGKLLDKKKVPYQAVVTEISFDLAQATPLLGFKPKAFLNDEQFAQVREVAEGDVVQAIMGSNYIEDQEGVGDTGPAAPAQAAPQPNAPAPQPTAAPTPAPKPAPKPKATPKPTVTEDEVNQAVAAAAAGDDDAPAAPKPASDMADFNIDDLNFDD